MTNFHKVRSTEKGFFRRQIFRAVKTFESVIPFMLHYVDDIDLMGRGSGRCYYFNPRTYGKKIQKRRDRKKISAKSRKVNRI